MRLMRELLTGVTFRELPMDISKFLKTAGERDPDLIFCGRLHVDVDLVDVAQGVRSVFAEAPMYYVSSLREGFDQKALSRNGFADAFLLPMDKGVLSGLVPDGAIEYKDVPLVDISSGTMLEFDTYVYLPLNGKYVRFTSAGRKFEGERAQRLMDNEVRSVYVSKEQLPAYHRFTATQLKKIANNPNSTEEDRRQQMHKAVRTLLAGFLTDNSAMQDYSEILKTYVLESAAQPNSAFERMLKFANGADDAYSHVSNVSSLAAIFSLGLSVGKTEDVALAGLLHDIGLADVPLDVQEKEYYDRDEREQQLYKEHPNLALKIIAKRQIEISTKVLKIIEQHHERWDASGYPKELRGDAIFPESQLIAIADDFEYLTQVKAGRAQMNAREAMQHLLSSEAFSPDLRQRLTQLLGL